MLEGCQGNDILIANSNTAKTTGFVYTNGANGGGYWRIEIVLSEVLGLVHGELIAATREHSEFEFGANAIQ